MIHPERSYSALLESLKQDVPVAVETAAYRLYPCIDRSYLEGSDERPAAPAAGAGLTLDEAEGMPGPGL